MKSSKNITYFSDPPCPTECTRWRTKISDFHVPKRAHGVHLGGCYSTPTRCARRVPPKYAPSVPRVHPFGGCYSNRRATYRWSALVLVPAGHCAPRDACSASAIVPAEHLAEGALWCLLSLAIARQGVPSRRVL